jgi:hypothetical protein
VNKPIIYEKIAIRILYETETVIRRYFVFSTAHPWLRDDQRQIPLDILIYRLIKQYLRATPLKRLALKVYTIDSHDIISICKCCFNVSSILLIVILY